MLFFETYHTKGIVAIIGSYDAVFGAYVLVFSILINQN